MAKLHSTPPEAVLVAIDMSKHRQEVLPERPEGGRRRRMTVTALANKMARQIWAMLTKNEDYKNPMPLMAT